MPKIAMSPGRWLYLALAVLLVGGLVVAARVVYPPVEVIVMTTGTPGSAYDVFAQQYKERLARDGIELRLEPSAGEGRSLARRQRAHEAGRKLRPPLERLSEAADEVAAVRRP